MPAIYLYPTKAEDVSVQLNFKYDFRYVYPPFTDASRHQWNVYAEPSGMLTDRRGKKCNYLFWEGVIEPSADLSQGFVVEAGDTESFLAESLVKLGLNMMETAEFLVYRVPKLCKSKSNLVTFATELYAVNFPMKIEPAPNTLIRMFMMYRPLSAGEKTEVESLELKAPPRVGFTVVE
jgi:hypothetical protein